MVQATSKMIRMIDFLPLSVDNYLFDDCDGNSVTMEDDTSTVPFLNTGLEWD